MATANTIEARLRIAADLAEAIKGLRELRKEIVDTDRAADSIGSTVAAKTTAATKTDRSQAAKDNTAAAQAATRAATEQAQAEQAAAQAARAAAREKTEDARRAARETADAAQAAARATAGQAQAEREAARAARAAARQRFDEEREARRQARIAERQAAEERRQARRREREEERRAAAVAAAEDKKRRAESFKATQLAPQLTDIGVSLASGQNPLLVAIQQGGQLRDIYGGFGNALRALMSVVTPARVAIGGIGLAFLAVAKGAFDGRQEVDLLNKTLALTGNSAATSVGQVDVLARRVAAEQRVAIGQVRENLQGLVATGTFVGSTLDSAARATSAWRKVTGASAEEAIKHFDDMGEGVSAWAAKQNRAYNFLTTEQVKYIRTLESEGRTQEAMRFTLDELTKTLEGRVAPNIGLIERAWLAAGRAVSSFAEQLKAIGRDTTAEERLEELKRQLQQLEELARKRPKIGLQLDTLDERQREALRREIETRQKELARSNIRTLDNSAGIQKGLEEQKRLQLSYQNELAQLDLAGARKRQQIRLNELDAQQSAAEGVFARGLVSARDHARELNRIDQQRIQAQIAVLQRQRELAETKNLPGNTGSQEEKRAVKAELLQVEQQLLAAQSQLRAKAAEGRNQDAAAQLQEERDAAARRVAVWQQAAERVRQLSRENAAARAETIADPRQRAAAEAAAAVAALRDDLKQRQTELTNAMVNATDEARAELQEKYEALGREAGQAIERGMRETNFGSLQAQLGEQLEGVQLQEDAIDEQVRRGALTTQEAERKKIAARQESIEQLDKILALMAEMARTPAERNMVERARQQIDVMKNFVKEFEATARSAAVDGFRTFFVDVVTGAEKADKAFGNMVKNFARAMLDLIARRLGEQLLKSLWPADGAGGGASAGASGGGGGNWWAAIAQIIASFFHTGGIIGRAGGVARAVSPTLFAGAQILHAGGLVGLKPNERPVIAEVGEEMLTEDNPRHIKNFRGGSGPVIGNLTIGVSIEGTGNNAEDEATGQALARGLHHKVRGYIAEEMRPGGILAHVAPGSR